MKTLQKVLRTPIDRPVPEGAIGPLFGTAALLYS